MIRWNFIGACLLTVLLTVAAGASERTAEAADTGADADDVAGEIAAEAPSASALQALTVTRDPQTGALAQPGHAPPTDEAKALSEELHRMLREKAAGFSGAYRVPLESGPAKRFDGIDEYRLGLEHLSFAIVRVAEDGTLVQECAEGTDDAARQVREAGTRGDR